MNHLPQTNLQLYELLLSQGRPAEDLALARRTYDFCITAFGGLVMTDGRPWLIHAVGMAGVLAELGLPTRVVAAALLHDVYDLADFGDARFGGPTKQRRQRIRDLAGAEVEALVSLYGSYSLNADTLASIRGRLSTMSQDEKLIVLMDLADAADRHRDASTHYSSHPIWSKASEPRVAFESIELAEMLEQPRLAEMLRSVFAAAERTDIAPAMRMSHSIPWTTAILPPSVITRPDVTLRRLPWRAWWWFCRAARLRRAYDLTLGKLRSRS